MVMAERTEIPTPETRKLHNTITCFSAVKTVGRREIPTPETRKL